jgi:hypothetical protein
VSSAFDWVLAEEFQVGIHRMAALGPGIGETSGFKSLNDLADRLAGKRGLRRTATCRKADLLGRLAVPA